MSFAATLIRFSNEEYSNTALRHQLGNQKLSSSATCLLCSDHDVELEVYALACRDRHSWGALILQSEFTAFVALNPRRRWRDSIDKVLTLDIVPNVAVLAFVVNLIRINL